MKITATILLSLLTYQALATTFNIEDRIKSEKLALDTYSSVFGSADFAHKKTYLSNVKDLSRRDRDRVLKFIRVLDKSIPEEILRPLSHWKVIKEDSQKTSEVLQYLMAYKLFIIRDFIDDPLTEKSKKGEAVSLLQELLESKDVNSNNISKYFENLKAEAQKLAKLKDHETFTRELLNNKIVSVNLQETIPDISPYSLSALGFVPSNKTEIVSENDVSLERLDWLNQRVMFAGGVLDFDASYIKMPTKDDPEGHIIFKEDPIYMKIREMIDRAEHSVFIDIFLFGGTLGATLSEYLLDETLKRLEKNPDFKVMILHDYATNYNMVDEMLPIFQYIQKRIKEDPKLNKAVSLLQANIQRHPPGIPFKITELIPKDENTFKYFESGNTYYESKIDINF